ncbi:MAG: nitroreductase family protein [Acidimicrobiia bacterium]
MSDADLFSVVHRQRACRAFSEREVDDADLARILDAATFAPSAENRQPWEFVVVRDDELRGQVHELTVRAWEAGGRAFAASRLEPALLEEVDAGITGGGYRGAPVLVVVAADTTRCLEATIASSIYPATQNLLLAATALGIGSAFTTITTAFSDELRALLGLPDHVLPQVVVPLGYPAKPLGPPRREPFADHTHRDHYGSAW